MTPYSEAEKTTCFKCRMTFRIEEPGHDAEITRCADCRRRFWHQYTRPSASLSVAVVGVFPE